MELSLVQFSFRAANSIDIESVGSKIVKNPTSALWFCSAVAQTTFVNKDIVFELQVTNNQIKKRSYSKKTPKFLHVKAFVPFTKNHGVVGEINIKIHGSGSIQCTLSWPQKGKASKLNHVMDVVAHGVQKYISQKIVERKVNLINGNVYWNKGHPGSFDLESLLDVYTKAGYDVKLSNSARDDLSGSTRILVKRDEGVSGLLHRKGSFQIRIKKPEGGVNSAIQWGIDVAEVLGSAEAQKHYDGEPDLMECAGNPVPTPRSFTGTCPEGYYVIPNARGEPCCKPLPKYKASATFKRTVAKKYSSRGIEIPASLTMFTDAERSRAKNAWPVKPNPVRGCVTKGVAGDTKGKIAVNAVGEKVFLNQKDCSKIPAAEVKRMAKNAGIDIKPLRTRAKICKALDDLSKAGFNGLSRQGVATNNTVGQYTSNATKEAQRLKSLLDKTLEDFDGDRCRIGTVKRGMYPLMTIKRVAQIVGLTGVSKLKKEELCRRVNEKIAQLKRNKAKITNRQ